MENKNSTVNHEEDQRGKGKTEEKTKNELEMKICEHTKSITNTN